ncbi:GNAT family N-acetyltransferase [Aurantibacillus circumpalustris]|uniref:GNAT family N-acetyltransferase n=1 Tax=Aurantibacillus circumpalustris TaxID=3036359 RepID=UPI00295A7A41|nr:GNAT family N-acetyltransferase [Aurantibacillus circumpalustris]
MQIFLKTERLILREILPSDEMEMFELDSDKDVHKYLGNQPFTRIDDSREIISFIRKQYEDAGIGRWAVINKTTNEFMGWAGLKLVKDLTNYHINYYDLGYRFIKRYWGNGYATEAAKAIISYGFSQMKLNEIYAMADVNNLKSIKVLEKSGLIYVEDFDFQKEPHVWYKISKP